MFFFDCTFFFLGAAVGLGHRRRAVCFFLLPPLSLADPLSDSMYPFLLRGRLGFPQPRARVSVYLCSVHKKKSIPPRHQPIR